MSVILLKITLVPVLIGLVTLAGRRWGNKIGGALACLPVIAAPILLFIAIEQGISFASTASHGALLGLISTTLFALTFAQLSQTTPWPVTLVSSWVVWGTVTAIFGILHIPLILTLIVVLMTVTGALRMLPVTVDRNKPIQAPRWEMAARMFAGAILVVIISEGAAHLGPQLSGMLAPFPIAASVLCAFIHRFQGPGAVVVFIRGFLWGIYGYALFLLVLAKSLSVLGISGSFMVALSTTLVVQVLTISFTQRLQPRVEA